MHNAAFRRLGLNCRYLPIEVRENDLPVVVAGIARVNFAGFNVTIPHKVRVMELLDQVDAQARIIGAVNTVVIEAGRTSGFNTDGAGYLRSLEAETGFDPAGRRVLLMGCGGAARAIAMTLALRGAGEILLCNRTERKAHELAEEIVARAGGRSAVVPFTETAIRRALQACALLINTTSIGMHPDPGRSPVEAGWLHAGLIVSDIVYNPLQTRLLADAAAKGCRIVPGLGMLVHQGAEGFRRWTGCEPPVAAMFAAARAHFGGA
jgi:shikimate dehydrogenase